MGVHTDKPCPDQIGISNVGVCGSRETGEPGEKPLEQGENQQQTKPT